MKPGLRTPGFRTLFVSALMLATSACVTINAPEHTVRESEQGPRDAPDLSEAARINTDLGMNYARRGILDVALDKFKRAISQNDDYAPAYAGAAFVYQQRGDTERAAEYYSASLRRDPNNFGTRNRYGVFLCSLKRYADAEEQFVLASRTPSPVESANALNNAGVCAKRIPDDELAEAYFRASLKVKPDFPDPLRQMAGLMVKQGDFPRAQAFLRRYEQVGPETPATLWMGGRIESVLGNRPGAQNYVRRLHEKFPDSKESQSTRSRPAS